MPRSCTRWSLPERLFQGPHYRAETSATLPEADEEKVSLRMQVYAATGPHRTVLDLYAGKGLLAWLYARHGCERLVCVERNPAYLTALKRNIAEFSGRVRVVERDNLAFLREGLPPHEPVTYVDFDAFADPSPQVQTFFEVHSIRRLVVLALTDAAIYNFRRTANANLLRRYLQDFHGGRRPPRDGAPNQMLGECVFQIQRQFIDILAMSHEAQAWPLYFHINRRRTVAYSAYLVMPRLRGMADFKRYVGLKTLPHPPTPQVTSKMVVKSGAAK